MEKSPLLFAASTYRTRANFRDAFNLIAVYTLCQPVAKNKPKVNGMCIYFGEEKGNEKITRMTT